MTRVHWAYLTYAFTAIGAIGLYLALPRSGQSRRAVPLICGAAATGGLLATLRYGLGEAAASNVYFYLLAFLTVGGAVRVVTQPRPVYSALYFVLVVLTTAGLAVMAGAEFVAAALVIVYAGAILVTYVFVIMLAQQSPGGGESGTKFHYDTNAREPGLAVMAGFALLATLTGAIVGRRWPASVVVETDAGNTLSVGRELLTTYAVAVELAGVLLLVAMIGALAIARKRLPADDEAAFPASRAARMAAAPPGEAGRTAEPF